MIELHLIGYTEDGERLVLDLDADGEGRYTVPVDPDLLATVAQLRDVRVRRGLPVDRRPRPVLAPAPAQEPTPEPAPAPARDPEVAALFARPDPGPAVRLVPDPASTPAAEAPAAAGAPATGPRSPGAPVADEPPADEPEEVAVAADEPPADEPEEVAVAADEPVQLAAGAPSGVPAEQEAAEPEAAELETQRQVPPPAFAAPNGHHPQEPGSAVAQERSAPAASSAVPPPPQPPPRLRPQPSPPRRTGEVAPPRRRASALARPVVPARPPGASPPATPATPSLRPRPARSGPWEDAPRGGTADREVPPPAGPPDGPRGDAPGEDADDAATPERSSPAAPDSALSPAEIQAALREGRSVRAVAADAGTDVTWIERWLPPIEAERERMLAEARARSLDVPGARPLGEVVDEELATRGVPEDKQKWSASRRPDGRWRVTVRFEDRGRPRTATWSLDPAGDRLRGASPFATELASPARRSSRRR